MTTEIARPAGVRYLSAVLLVSVQPERLAAFYRDILGLSLVEERHGDSQAHWGCELGDVHFAIHPLEDYPEDPRDGGGAVKLAFMVFELTELVEWLEANSVPLCYPPQPLGTGSLVTAVRDPDGNLVELTQLGASWLGHLKRRRAEGSDLVDEWGRHVDQAATDEPI
jgi:catechol 2,3-dioxygenase-like lactoylglutathione lyase family enzyme